jgi:hydroxymethylpyrimidine pyrophosphatase-like HAD family hydrolase
VYDVRSRSIVKARTIPVETGLRAAALLREAIPGTTFAVEKTDGFGKEPQFMPRMPPPPEMAVGPLDEILDETTVKLLARHEDLDPEEFWAEVEARVGDTVMTTWSSTGALVEMSAAGVTKASTLELLCGEHQLTRDEVLAFGDMPNDLPMLAWAGTSYAMANAHPLVRERAGRLAPSNQDDGVAVVLERLFGLTDGP